MVAKREHAKKKHGTETEQMKREIAGINRGRGGSKEWNIARIGGMQTKRKVFRGWQKRGQIGYTERDAFCLFSKETWRFY